VNTGPQHVYSSAVAAAAYLREHFPAGSPVYVFGEEGLKQAAAAQGFVVCEGEQKPEYAAAVVVGMDRGLTYGKLTVASQLVAEGVPFIATNADRSFPTLQGVTPGAGSLIAAISAVTGVEPVVIGKPEPALFHAAMQQLNAHPETTAMLGDRLDTDILGGQRAGIGTILVLSGVTDRAALAASAIRLDLVYESIAELANDLTHA
jgi:4-nitrophenyl phosphatase